MAGVRGLLGRVGRASVLCAVAVGTSGAAGCGFVASEIVEQHHIAKKARAYEFKGGLDATWAEAKVALEEGGYRLEGDPKVDETVACPGPEDHFRRSRAHLRITKTGWFSHRLEIDILEETLRDGAWKRQPARQASEIEWKIVKRRDPDYAANVEADAEAKGEKGRKIVKDIDDLLSE